MRALAAALALVVAAPSAAQTPLAFGETLLEVTATGTVKAVPDRAEISTGVTSDAATAREAIARNAAAAQALVAAVTAAGVAERDIRTSELSVEARYRQDKDGDDTQEVLGYRAENRLTVLVRDVARAPLVVEALARAGATELSGPRFSFADTAPLTRGARADAVKAARAQADDYAAALGLRIARVVRVSERGARAMEGGDIVVTAARGRLAPVLPGEQETSVTVWIDYALAPAR